MATEVPGLFSNTCRVISIGAAGGATVSSLAEKLISFAFIIILLPIGKPMFP